MGRWIVATCSVAFALAVGANAMAGTSRENGYRLVSNLSSQRMWREGGWGETTLLGLTAAWNRPIARRASVELEFGYGLLGPNPDTNRYFELSYDGGPSSWGWSDFTTLTPALELRPLASARPSLFVRGGAGPALLHIGRLAGQREAGWIDVPGRRVLGWTTSTSLGLGRLPGKGLGWEASLELRQFLGADDGFSSLGFAAGLVY